MQEEQVGLWKYIQTFGLVTSPSCNLLLTAQVSKGSPVQVCAHLEWNCYSSPNVVGGGQRVPFPKCLLPPGGILSGFPQTLETESLGMKLCPREASSLVTLLIIWPTFSSKLSSVGSQLEAHSVPDRGISCIRDARA